MQTISFQSPYLRHLDVDNEFAKDHVQRLSLTRLQFIRNQIMQVRRQVGSSMTSETMNGCYYERHDGGLDSVMSKSPTSQKRMRSC